MAAPPSSGKGLAVLLGLLTLPGILAQGARAGEGADRARFTSPGPYPVGVRTVVLVDPSRDDGYAGPGRTLVTEIWYPAAQSARGAKPTRFVDFFGAHPEAAEAFVQHFGSRLEGVNRRFKTVSIRNAPLRKGRYPLLVFSHGNGGVRHQNIFQMDHLASHGYVVASPDHTGNAGVTVIPGGGVSHLPPGGVVVPYDRKGRPRSMLDRPADVRFILDRLLEASRTEGHWLHRALDPQAIGLLGHSFGALTSLQASAEDPRVKAVLAMTVAAPRSVSVPLMLLIGRLDRTIRDAGNFLNTAYYVSASPPKHLLVLKRGGHFSFTDMDSIQPAFGDGIGVERKNGRTVKFLDCRRAKDIINAYSLAFFDAYVRGNPAARGFLGKNHYPADIEYRWEQRAPKAATTEASTSGR